MRLATWFVAAGAFSLCATDAAAQYGGDAGRRAEEACKKAATRETKARHPRAERVQIYQLAANRVSNVEWTVAGTGQFDNRRDRTRRFSFSCTYNSRTSSAYAVDWSLDSGAGGGYVPPGTYPPGPVDRPPVTGAAKGLLLTPAQPNNTVRDIVRAGRTKSYSVEAREGGILNIGLRVDGDGQAFFDVRDPLGRLIFRGDQEGNIHRGRMEGRRGAYRIDVYGQQGMRGADRTSYYLDVALSYQ